jgi:hypothetical protein
MADEKNSDEFRPIPIDLDQLLSEALQFEHLEVEVEYLSKILKLVQDPSGRELGFILTALLISSPISELERKSEIIRKSLRQIEELMEDVNVGEEGLQITERLSMKIFATLVMRLDGEWENKYE